MQEFFFPDLSVTIMAETLEEATNKLNAPVETVIEPEPIVENNINTEENNN